MNLIEEGEPFVSEFLQLFECDRLAAFHSAAVNKLASHTTSFFDVLQHGEIVLGLLAELTLLLCCGVLDESRFHFIR